MEIYTSQHAIKEAISMLKGKKIGFVPTMGALHRGHTSLMVKAKAECDVVVASIFVNPTQFNDPKDFEKYPIRTEKDLEILKNVGCDMVFLPNSIEEVYANEKTFKVDLGILDKIMEGVGRPGHFDGVMRVVKLLFEIIEPTHSYFGLKDYQQYKIIEAMVQQLGMNIQVIPCPIIREADGLAKSSRNLRLTIQQRQIATTLFKTLNYAKEHYTKTNREELEKQCFDMMRQYGEPEYFVIRRADNLEEPSLDYKGEIRAFVVCKIGKIRLIDNMQIA